MNTPTVNHPSYHAIIRIAVKRQARIPELSATDFLSQVNTTTFYHNEHNLTGNGPLRCRVCAEPLDIRKYNETCSGPNPYSAGFCDECNRVQDLVYQDLN